jgi:hypothetical protein
MAALALARNPKGKGGPKTALSSRLIDGANGPDACPEPLLASSTS